MVQTRAQKTAGVEGEPAPKDVQPPKKTSKSEPKKEELVDQPMSEPQEPPQEEIADSKPSEVNGNEPSTGDKRKSPDAPSPPPTKAAKTEDEHPPPQAESQPQQDKNPASSSHNNPKLSALLEKYGQAPLSDIPNLDASTPSAQTILAHVFHAMLTSARISHKLAYKSVLALCEAGYADIHKLKASSWDERCDVLTKGGYTRYREKTATGLAELAEFVLDRYSGDLNNLLNAAESDRGRVRDLLKEIKGLGDVGADIFMDTVQGVWPVLAPSVDGRSLKEAEELGLGADVGALWKEVGEDAGMMVRLSAALTKVRLEKLEGQAEDEMQDAAEKEEGGGAAAANDASA